MYQTCRIAGHDYKKLRNMLENKMTMFDEIIYHSIININTIIKIQNKLNLFVIISYKFTFKGSNKIYHIFSWIKQNDYKRINRNYFRLLQIILTPKNY